MQWQKLRDNSTIRRYKKKAVKPLNLIRQGKAVVPDRTLKEYERRKRLGIPIPGYIEKAVQASRNPKTGKNLKHYKKARQRLMNKRESEHRRNPTPAEKALYKGLKVVYPELRLQKGIMLEVGRFYILDLFLPSCKIAIEADGSSHKNNADYDKHRDALLERKGIKTLRFSNDEIFADIQDVVTRIVREVSIRRGGISFSTNNSPHAAELQAHG